MKKLAVLLLIVCCVMPVFAQEPATPPADEKVRWTLASEQIKHSLDSPSELIRTQTLKNMIVMATLYRDKVDMTVHTKLIRKVYEESTSRAHRKLALAALQAIGGYRAYDYMERNAGPADLEEGRMVVASVLNEYYTSRTTSG